MKKITKILFIIVIIAQMVTYNSIVVATNKSDLQEEKSNINSSISEAKDELDELEEEKSEALNTVQKLTVQISDYEQEITELKDGIETLGKQIDEAEENIKKEEEEYEKNQKALNERLVAMYENGNTSYLDYFLSSSSLTDFISNYYLLSEIADYDTQLLEEIENEKNRIEKEKEKLENDKSNLNSAKISLEAKTSNLKIAKSQKESQVANLSEKEKQTQEKIEELEADKAIIEKQLRQIAAAEEAERKRQEEAKKKNSTSSSGNSTTTSSGNSANTSTPSVSGFVFPVQGLSKSNIRNRTYPSYPGHTGVDVNINVTGKNVIAAKAGTVVTSTALRNSNGSYRSYGEYIIISHGDGTLTLYAHMLSGSRKVNAGDRVSQGQVIGTVGSTGNSTGNHLHFEVRVSSYNSSLGTYSYKAVNPLPYLP